jgi:transposase
VTRSLAYLSWVTPAKTQSHIQEERVMAIMNWIGIDDHADKWTIAHLRGADAEPTREFELIPGESAYRRLISYAKELKGKVRIVYEAGPCGYELYRRLTAAGLDCGVAAPSLTPKKSGERIKTNRRDAKKLARYLRAGELTLITVPDRELESLRDLVRGRHNVQQDLVAVRNQISKLLLRYGHRYRIGKAWTQGFWRWLRAIKLEGHSATVLTEMIGTHDERAARIARFDADIEAASKEPAYAAYVQALCTLRGINTLSAMTILSELGDLRRYESAPKLMASIGLVPSEYSTGESVKRFAITKTGNAHVRHVAVEAAWHYQRPVRTGPTIRRRRKDQPAEVVAIAEKCELRLNRKFNRMTSRRKRSTIAAVAVARELIGFVWAIGQQVHP